MKMFKKKDGDPKKIKTAVKKTAKSATKEGASEGMQSMVKPKRVSTLKRIVKDVPMKRVPVSTLTRSVKTVMKPASGDSLKPSIKLPEASTIFKSKPSATIQRSTRNSKTGAVTKSAPKEMKMKSISKKEYDK
jgi:hypothetical protein